MSDFNSSPKTFLGFSLNRLSPSILKTAVATTMVGAMATPALADPPVTRPQQYIPPVFCFRMMDIEVTGQDRFRFEFEVLNWTDTPVNDVAIALTKKTDLGFVEGSGTVNQPSTLPWSANGGNQVITNDWAVDSTKNSLTSIHWDGGTEIPSVDLLGIAQDNENPDPAIAKAGALADINTFLNFPNKDFNPNDPETFDNGRNVLGGFIFEADNFQSGEVLSFNWVLTKDGKPVGVADGRGNDFGFGVVNIARADDQDDFNGLRPTFPGLGNTGFTHNERDFGSPQYDGGPQFFMEVGASVTAPFLNPSDSKGIPEPLTILGAGTALGFGSFFKSKLNKKQKKDQTSV